MEGEATGFYKKLDGKISKKSEHKYSEVISFIRLRFEQG